MKKQSLVGYLLTDFIYTFPGRAHYKESTSFTYQISNQHNLDLYDLSENQLIGKTVYDLKRHLMKDKWLQGFAESIDASDKHVVATKEAVNLTDKIFLDNSGALVIHSMVKLPVFNQQQAVKGVLTLSFDGPHNGRPYKVKEAYGQFYKGQEANTRFMRHIGFDDGVKLKLTPRETDCLMSLVKYRTNKAASRSLDISVKTIDNHLSRIRGKCEAYGYTKDLVAELSSILSGI